MTEAISQGPVRACQTTLLSCMSICVFHEADRNFCFHVRRRPRRYLAQSTTKVHCVIFLLRGNPGKACVHGEHNNTSVYVSKHNRYQGCAQRNHKIEVLRAALHCGTRSRASGRDAKTRIVCARKSQSHGYALNVASSCQLPACSELLDTVFLANHARYTNVPR